MIKGDAIQGDTERFADAAASGHQKGKEVRYVMFDGAMFVRNPGGKLARLSDSERSWSVLGFGRPV
jgi:hypothetical protein